MHSTSGQLTDHTAQHSTAQQHSADQQSAELNTDGSHGGFAVEHLEANPVEVVFGHLQVSASVVTSAVLLVAFCVVICVLVLYQMSSYLLLISFADNVRDVREQLIMFDKCFAKKYFAICSGGLRKLEI